MTHIEKSILIDAPVEDVYAYATFIPRATEWWSSLIDLHSDAGDRITLGLKSNWTYKMLGMKFHGTSEYVEVVPNRRVVWKNETGIPSTFETRFDDAGGKTRYTMVVDYTVPGSILGKIADRLFVERHNEHETVRTLENLKHICESEAAMKAGGAAKGS